MARDTRKKMKRKVKAQRKFAQGAFVPPSSSNINLPERRLDVSNKKEPKIIYNSISAKSLLDFVSLKTLHSHLQPYVLLERMQASANNADVLRPPNNADVPRPAKLPNAVPKVKLMPLNKIPFDMRLRSRRVKSSIGNRSRKNKIIPSVTKSNPKRPSNLIGAPRVPKSSQTVDNFSLEDNKPLTFFASHNLLSVASSSQPEKRSNDDTAEGTPKTQKRKKRSPVRRASKDYMMTRSRSKSAPRCVVESPIRSISRHSKSTDSLTSAATKTTKRSYRSKSNDKRVPTRPLNVNNIHEKRSLQPVPAERFVDDLNVEPPDSDITWGNDNPMTNNQPNCNVSQVPLELYEPVPVIINEQLYVSDDDAKDAKDFDKVFNESIVIKKEEDSGVSSSMGPVLITTESLMYAESIDEKSVNLKLRIDVLDKEKEGSIAEMINKQECVHRINTDAANRIDINSLENVVEDINISEILAVSEGNGLEKDKQEGVEESSEIKQVSSDFQYYGKTRIQDWINDTSQQQQVPPAPSRAVDSSGLPPLTTDTQPIVINSRDPSPDRVPTDNSPSAPSRAVDSFGLPTLITDTQPIVINSRDPSPNRVSTDHSLSAPSRTVDSSVLPPLITDTQSIVIISLDSSPNRVPTDNCPSPVTKSLNIFTNSCVPPTNNNRTNCPSVASDSLTFIIEKAPLLDQDPSPDCPCNRFKTLNDLCCARNDTIKFCLNYCKCRIIKGIHTLIKTIHSPSQKKDNGNEITSDDRLKTLRERLRRRLSRPQGSATTDTNTDGISKSVNLDILPLQELQIIEITSSKSSNPAKCLLSAKLINKSRARNLPLIRRDDTIEKVLKTMCSNIVNLQEQIEVIVDWDEKILNSTADSNIEEPLPQSQWSFPNRVDKPTLVEAPVYYPTKEEFMDPILYIEKIIKMASKFGLCKIVAPADFKPKCELSEGLKFGVSNQYISRLYNRWSPVTREMCVIKAYLGSQSVVFTKAPLMHGLEINLPKLYHIVQRLGGLQTVIRKNRWGRVAQEMRFTKGKNPGVKLDLLYVKYLLPYDTLSHEERQKISYWVENMWQKKNSKMLERAINPFHRQKQLLGESDSSEDEPEDNNGTLNFAEECVVVGRPMILKTFQKVATNAMETYYPGDTPPPLAKVEEDYWRLVLLNTDHVSVNSASIDTSVHDFGFTRDINDPYSTHPWNMKVISNNKNNVLRSMGPVLGVTVPTMHLGMLYSTSCWHRDPHGLPWIEYLHSGPGKVWYGIPDEQSDNFRKAVEKLCPTACQNKSIWLASDITMIPPNLLQGASVSLSRIEQKPGEFIVVFPKAYSSSFSTGYTESESVYFATSAWLNTIHQVFQEARESCEPTMFAMEQLLMSLARDPTVPLGVLQQVHSNLKPYLDLELSYRHSLEEFNIFPKPASLVKERKRGTKKASTAWNAQEQDECLICHRILYLSKVVNLVGKKTTICPLHALYVLKKPKRKRPPNVELYVNYDEEQLIKEIKDLQKRITPTMSPGPSTSAC